MKSITVLLFTLLCSSLLLAQTQERALKISLQTDLIAYTAPGGWSAWVAVQHHQNKLSLAYVNFPDRYADYYEASGLKETDRFFRIQYARYVNPEKALKNLYLGVNLEYHVRELEEDNNPLLITDTGIKIAPIVGYEWHPWGKKDNALQNLSLALWVGPTFLISYDKELTFEGTGSVYEARGAIEGAVGLLVSYTIVKN